MRTGTPPTDFCSVTRPELFGPAPLSASAFSLCITAGGVGTPADCSMGALAPANTLVPPRVIAREAVSRLFISARQWEDFSLDFIVGFRKLRNGQHCGSAPCSLVRWPAQPLSRRKSNE